MLWACTLKTTGENAVRKWQSAGQVWTKRMDHIHWHTVDACLQAMGFPGGSDGKESACQCRTRKFDPWVRKTEPSFEEVMVTHSSFMPAESDGQRSLAGYSAWQKSWTRLSDWSCMHAPWAIRVGGEWLWDTMTLKKPRIFTSAAGFLSCADTHCHQENSHRTMLWAPSPLHPRTTCR